MNLTATIDRLQNDDIRVFVDSASASLPSAETLQLHVEYLRSEAAWGGMEARRRYADSLQEFYQNAASFIGAKPSEIALVANASSAWSTVLNAMELSAGDEIILHETEFLSNFFSAHSLAKRTGAVIRMAESDGSGRIDVAKLRGLITPRTRLIACVHIPAHTSLINPVKELGQLARSEGIPFLLDAAQSIGHLDLSRAAGFCDVLVGTSRKFLRGPRGAGILYATGERIKDLRPPFPDLMTSDFDHTTGRLEYADGAAVFESNDRPYAAQAALGVAVLQAEKTGQAWIESRIRALGHDLRSHLQSIPGAHVLDADPADCGIVTFQVDGLTTAETRMRLARRGILLADVPARAILDPSRRARGDRLRASVHYFNTEAEVFLLAKEIENLLMQNH